MANIAGRILIMPRGTYDANATYELLDLVLYNNASWLAKKTATGIEPAEGEYWHKMADGVELVTNLTTEEEGKALDASMGKVLKDLIDAIGADALRERITNLETANTSQGEAIVAIEGDIDELRASIEALGNIDNATVRYVSDEADENFDWIQVQDADGNWINAYRAYTQRYELYVDQNNCAEFEAYKGTITYTSTGSLGAPTVTFADTMRISQPIVSGGQGFGCVISKLIDLSRFKTIKFHHVSNTVGSSVAFVKFFITQSKSTIMSPIVSQELSKSSSDDADISIDISELNGEYYLGIEFNSYSSTQSSCEISDMYME